MNLHEILSDQSLTWSAKDETKTHLRLKKTASGPATPTPLSDRYPPRLAHHALQAVWQARLQMRPGSRSRPQVLPLGQLSPFAPANGLCAAGVLCPDQEVPGQLSARSQDLGGDLRDQSRTVAPPGGALRNDLEPYVLLHQRAHRSRPSQRALGQHAGDLVGRPARTPEHRGGNQ